VQHDQNPAQLVSSYSCHKQKPIAPKEAADCYLAIPAWQEVAWKVLPAAALALVFAGGAGAAGRVVDGAALLHTGVNGWPAAASTAAVSTATAGGVPARAAAAGLLGRWPVATTPTALVLTGGTRAASRVVNRAALLHSGVDG
jgi:hypothetical protein